MRILFLILSGAVSGMAYAAYDLPIIIYLSLIPFFYVVFDRVQKSSPVKMYWYGFAFFYPYHIAVFHWFTYQYPLDFLDFTKFQSVCYIILAWFGVALLMTILFSFIPVCIWFFVKISKKRNVLCPLFASCAWCIFEWLNSKTIMAVPWARLALTQQNNIFTLQSASVLGSFFVSFTIAAFAAFSAYGLLVHKESLRTSLICGLCAALLVTGNSAVGMALYSHDVSKQSGDIITVSALQGNMPSGEKWEEGSSYDALTRYLDMIYEEGKAHDTDVFVIPETAIPVTLKYYSSYVEAFKKAAVETESVILVGAFDEDEDGNSANAIFAFTADGEMHERVYYKQHLVPFGEFMPFRTVLETLLPILSDINALGEDIVRGDEAVVFNTDSGNIGTLICFDSIFELLAAESVANGAELLAISTNDSWFDDSAAIFEHNGHAILRAIETRRCVIRAANTGLSSAITPQGQVYASLAPNLQGAVTTQVMLRNDTTFFVAHPNIFIAFCIAFCIIAPVAYRFAPVLYSRIRKKAPDASEGETDSTAQ